MFGHDLERLGTLTKDDLERLKMIEAAQEIVEREKEKGTTFADAMERLELAMEAGLPVPTK